MKARYVPASFPQWVDFPSTERVDLRRVEIAVRDRVHTELHMVRVRNEAGFCLVPKQLLSKQLQNQLLLLVGLGQGGNSGLFQNGVLGEAGHRRWNIGSGDGVLCRGQVLHLTVDDVAGCGQPVHARAQGAANAGDVGDGRARSRVRAVCASVTGDAQARCRVRLTALPPVPLVMPPVFKAPMVTEIWLDPIAVASLRKMLVGRRRWWWKLGCSRCRSR